MRSKAIGAVVGLAVLLTASPVFAASGSNVIRFGLQYVDPTGDFKADTLTVTPQGAFGVAFEYERMFTQLFGLDVGLAYSKHDVKFRDTFDVINNFKAETTMLPVTIGANYHPLKGKKADFYVGPMISYVQYGDLKAKTGTFITKLKKDFGYGVVVGVDFPLGAGKWGVSTQARYLQTKAKIDQPDTTDEIKFNPVTLQVAARVKF